MADDTKKPAEAKPTTPTASPTAAASAKSTTTKPAARASTATAAAPAVRKKAPATAKTAAATAKKTAHEPAPFAGKDDKADKPAKAKKAKLVRDSFTMPGLEYALIATLKKRCLDAGVSAKKSEILRAAVANLAKLSDASVVASVRRLEVVKTGRPAKKSK